MTDSVNTSHQLPSDVNYPWHKDTWSNFVNAKNQDHLPHAILLVGEEGIGKLKLAKRMAKSLLCMNTTADNTEACQQCVSCKTYHSFSNPDYLEIRLLEDKKQIGVDQIRALSEFLTFSRSYNTHRVVIINPVERMNLNAANSLLKSLEEPTPETIIILVTAKVSDLLATIKSRCQLLTVKTPTKDETIHWLEQNQATNNGAKIDAETLFAMVGSRPLKAEAITQEDIENKQNFFNDLSAVMNQSLSISDMAKKWEKHDFERLINWQLYVVQNAIKKPIGANVNTTEEGEIITQVSQHLNSEEHWHLYQNLIKQKQYIHTSVNPLMFLENMIMLWMKAGK